MGAELEYYKEQLAHGRHIETQRSTVATVAAALSGALIGTVLKIGPLTKDALPYTVTLIVVGIIALLLSAKLYERFKLHNTIAKYARNVVDPSLAKLRRDAESEHKKNFPMLFEIKLHIIWNVFFCIVSVLGFVLTLLILRQN